MNDAIIEACKIILAKAPTAWIGEQALRAIAAAQNDSPVVETRYNHLFQAALANGAQFTGEEMATLAGAVGAAGADKKTKTIQVRVTGAEYAAVEDKARAAGQSVSEYVRGKLDL